MYYTDGSLTHCKYEEKQVSLSKQMRNFLRRAWDSIKKLVRQKKEEEMR